jgi:hypothetical protein
LRAKKVEKLHNSSFLPEISEMNYRNQIPELGTTISGLTDNKKKNRIKNPVKMMNYAVFLPSLLSISTKS